jgi:hypothetical protein
MVPMQQRRKAKLAITLQQARPQAPLERLLCNLLRLVR